MTVFVSIENARHPQRIKRCRSTRSSRAQRHDASAANRLHRKRNTRQACRKSPGSKGCARSWPAADGPARSTPCRAAVGSRCAQSAVPTRQHQGGHWACSTNLSMCSRTWSTSIHTSQVLRPTPRPPSVRQGSVDKQTTSPPERPSTAEGRSPPTVDAARKISGGRPFAGCGHTTARRSASRSRP